MPTKSRCRRRMFERKISEACPSPSFHPSVTKRRHISRSASLRGSGSIGSSGERAKRSMSR